MLTGISPSYSARLSSGEFNKLSSFIYEEFGIKMPAAKHTMLESRLHKRLKSLKMSSFDEYCKYLFSPEGISNELVHMADVVTTNKTDFFREPAHFEFMREVMLPAFLQQDQKKIKIWSAGCSSGEEPYTIAMVMQEFIEEHEPIDYSILGTDLSTEVLAKAVAAIYTMDRVVNIPMTIKRKYFLKSKDVIKPTVRVESRLRQKARFQRLNFMDDYYADIQDRFDIIFCRNVLIYFDKATQEKVVNKICEKLNPGGYFFLGHSESLTGMNVPLKQLRPTIFQKI